MELSIEEFVIDMVWRILSYIYYRFHQPAIARTYLVWNPIDATMKISYFPQESYSMKPGDGNFSFRDVNFSYGSCREHTLEPVRQRVDVEIKHNQFDAKDYLKEAEQEVEEYLRYER